MKPRHRPPPTLSALRILRVPLQRAMVALALFTVAARAEPEPEPTQPAKGRANEARKLLHNAIRSQGALPAQEVTDVRLTFRGQASTPDQGTHVVARTYWWRQDHAFRVQTTAGADGSGSERGVIGRHYWERGKNGIRRLRVRNREDRGSVRTIRKERKDFERMLRLMLPSRLDAESTAVKFAAPAPVRIERDTPFELKWIFPDRKQTYHALEVHPQGEPRFVLFVDTKTNRIKKAVQYRRDAPKRIEFVYYFGAYKKDKRSGLVLPRIFSVHNAVPTDKKSRNKTGMVYGRVTLFLNEALPDKALRPPNTDTKPGAEKHKER